MNRSMSASRIMKWLIALLAIGMLLNVAIAWTVAAVAMNPFEKKTLQGDHLGQTSPSQPYWMWFRGGGWGFTWIEGTAVSFDSASPPSEEWERQARAFYEEHPKQSVPTWAELGEPGDVINGCEVRSLAYGWPFRSMYWGLRVRCESSTQIELRHAMLLSDLGFSSSHALPLGVIWAGFIVNPLIYAALVGAGLRLLVSIRRRRRVGRGLCPYCAYPAGSSDVCSECGRARPATDPKPKA